MGFFYAMKTRTQLELWKLVKDNFDEHFSKGLCILVLRLYIKEIISMDENNCIYAEIKKYGNTKDFFLGAIGDKKPRLDFIDKMITKYEQLD